MRGVRITKKLLNELRPGGRDYFVWDGDLPGFGIKVTPAGGMSFVIQYRLHGSKGATKRMRLGSCGVLTVEQARQQARSHLADVVKGGDPQRAKKERAEQLSVRQAFERFAEVHINIALSPSTRSGYRSVGKRYIVPVLGHLLVAEITENDAREVQIALNDKHTQANRVLAVMSKFFSWCENNGLRPKSSNPCRFIRRYREERRETFVRDAKLDRLLACIDDSMATGNISVYAGYAIKTLLMTGARKSEILNLRWSDIDFERTQIKITTYKRKQKYLVASDEVFLMLKSIPMVEGNPFVFVGAIEGRPIHNLWKPWSRVRRAAGLTDVTLHDLRHTFASHAINLGATLYEVGSLLGHTYPQTTARYAHLATERQRRLAGSTVRNMLGSRRP